MEPPGKTSNFEDKVNGDEDDVRSEDNILLQAIRKRNSNFDGISSYQGAKLSKTVHDFTNDDGSQHDLLSNPASLSFFDLQAFDIFPEIFRHFELRDFLNFSLVSKRIYDIVSSEIVRRSKIIFDPNNIRDFNHLKRNYDEISFENYYPDDIVKILRDETFKNVLKFKKIFLTIDEHVKKNILPFLNELKEIGGFEKFALQYKCYGKTGIEMLLDIMTKKESNEYSKIVENLTIREMLISCSSSFEFNFPFPGLKVLQPHSQSTITSSNNCNQLTKLILKHYYFQEDSKILKENYKTIKKVEVYKGLCNLLPAQPKEIKLFCVNCAHELLRGQRNLEVLTLQNCYVDGRIMDTLLENENLYDLTFDGCDFKLSEWNTKYEKIFIKLRKFVYKLPSPKEFSLNDILSSILKYLVNVSSLCLEVFCLRSPTERISLPKLERLTLIEERLNYQGLFGTILDCPSIKTIDIKYNGSKFIHRIITKDLNELARTVVIRNQLYSYQAENICKNIKNLESLTFLTTDYHGSLALKNILKMKTNVKYIKMVFIDNMFDRRSEHFRVLVETLRTLENVEIKGSIQPKCHPVIIEIFMKRPVEIHIPQKHSFIGIDSNLF